MLNKSNPGVRRGPKLKGRDAEIIVSFEDAVRAQATELQICINDTEANRFSKDDAEQVATRLRAAIRNLNLIAFIAKEMKPKSTRAEKQLKQIQIL